MVDLQVDYVVDNLDRPMVVVEVDNLDIPVGLVDLDKAEFELVEAGQDGQVHSLRLLVAHYQTLKCKIVPKSPLIRLPVHIISARPLRSDRPFFQSDKYGR